jgi:transcriptional regulator with XRE-family HTH domain
MGTIWRKLAKDKRYREEYALAMLKRMIPYQTRAIRRKREWSQVQLARAAGVTQGVISRAEDPDYGNLTLTTIGKIAAGYDLAAIVKFVPFSELVRQSETSSEREFANLPTFEQENTSPTLEQGNLGAQRNMRSVFGIQEHTTGAMRSPVHPQPAVTPGRIRVRREATKRRQSRKGQQEPERKGFYVGTITGFPQLEHRV